MNHEERHALGLWLIAALIGGFALFAWATGRLGERDATPAAPAEQSDSVPRAAASYGHDSTELLQTDGLAAFQPEPTGELAGFRRKFAAVPNRVRPLEMPRP